MDGKGYPKGLKREEMSWQARMIGIADIFEALTARDRPYKEGVKLSEALAILDRLSLNGHIDPALYAVFISSQVYRRYAGAFLRTHQIDC
jgi:HD-GYP domain-containing protein (c-di-GMP phosphodiesterase class II)